MALRDLIAQHGVDPDDADAVFALIRRLPLASEAKIRLWEEYAQESGFDVQPDERTAILT